MKPSHRLRPVFDEPNLVSAAGLVPALRVAESAGFYDLLDAELSVGSPNASAKATSVVGGMLAGADSIDGLRSNVPSGPTIARPSRAPVRTQRLRYRSGYCCRRRTGRSRCVDSPSVRVKVSPGEPW